MQRMQRTLRTFPERKQLSPLAATVEGRLEVSEGGPAELAEEGVCANDNGNQ